LSYTWDFGDGANGTGATPTHAYAASGVYTVRLTVSDGKGGSAAATTAVTVSNTRPVANPGGPYPALNKVAVTLDGSGSTDADGDALSYAWDFGDGTSATGRAPTHVYTGVGIYTVTLAVSDGELSSAIATTTVTVANQPPVANPGGPYSGRRNQAIAFDGIRSSDANNDSLTYSWNFGDGSFGSGATPSHAYAKSGTYTVSLVVSDGASSSASAATTVTVTNTAPVARLAGPLTIFKNQVAAFDAGASSDPDGDFLKFNWAFGDGAVSVNDVSNPSHFYSRAGVYPISVTATDGEAVSAPAATTLTVVNRPPVANAGPDQTVSQRSSVVFTGASSSDPDGFIVSYAWRQLSGPAVTLSNTTGVTTQFAAPTVKGGTSLQIVFELTVTDDDGATGTDQIVITVVK
jgi:PKD repeat protein